MMTWAADLPCSLDQPLGDYNGAWKELEKALEMGKVRAIGISDFDFNDELFESIVAPAKVKPQMFQIECHPYAQREHWQEMAAKYNPRWAKVWR